MHSSSPCQRIMWSEQMVGNIPLISLFPINIICFTTFSGLGCSCCPGPLAQGSSLKPQPWLTCLPFPQQQSSTHSLFQPCAKTRISISSQIFPREPDCRRQIILVCGLSLGLWAAFLLFIATPKPQQPLKALVPGKVDTTPQGHVAEVV